MELKMSKKIKRSPENQTDEISPKKKLKITDQKETNLEKQNNVKKKIKKVPKNNEKSTKINSNDKEVNNGNLSDKRKEFNKKELKGKFKSGKPNMKNFKAKKNFGKPTEKPADWKEYKEKAKELRIKRKKSKNLYEVISQAKKISEQLRIKELKGGKKEKIKICNELHELLGRQGIYAKLILSHDMARVIQYLIKFSAMEVRREVATELLASMVQLFKSKYATHCITHLLKYGDEKIRSNVLNSCYGNVVKLTSHSVSSPVFNNAYQTYATATQKLELMQEFFGDIYKESKDKNVKHIRDVYKNSPDMKSATLGATKANLQRILNKELLDSHLVQTVLLQFLQECSDEDRNEMIAALNSHLAILSNSKDGSRAAMICIWQGSKKDKKVAMKNLKDHVTELCKHEFGHCTIITLLDSIDDTVLLNKIILQEILTNASNLIESEWGRKVLAWLVSPGDTVYFHPLFLKELKEGKEKSESKKDTNIRREEILNYVVQALLNEVFYHFDKWFANSTKAMVTLAILKAGSGNELEHVLQLLSKFITNPDWKTTEKNKEIPGIEHAGYHMILKKLIKHDETKKDTDKPKFGETLVHFLDKDTVESWIKSNRQCFLFIFILETNSNDTQKKLRKKLNHCMQILKEQDTYGAKLLLKKLNVSE